MLEEYIVPSEEQMQAMRDRARDEVIERCMALYDEYKVVLKSGDEDVVFFDVSPMERFLGGSARGMVDKYKQVYFSLNGYLGGGVGIAGIGLTKLLGNENNTMSKKDMERYITGWSIGYSAYGLIGGAISIGESGGTVDVGIAGASININVAYTWKIYEF